jgi:hypothetical protein
MKSAAELFLGHSGFSCASSREHGDIQILEHFSGFGEVVIRSAGGGEFDGKGDDHRESVPFSCRLEDATSGNTQQLAATSGNSQRAEVKAFKQQAATGSNFRQHAATRPKPRC